MPVRRSTIAALSTAAVLVPMVALPGPALAAGEATPPAPQSEAEFCRNVPAGYAPFTDIAGNTFEATIECLAYAGITRGGPQGLGSDRYGPTLDVQRDEMAAFVVRLIDKANELDVADTLRPLPAYDGSPSFTDVAGNTHVQSIERLAQAGIVKGGPSGAPANQYGPRLGVSRAQMAPFLEFTLEYLTGDEFSTMDDYFTDDENALPHEPRIDVVAAEGIAVGDGRDTYNPAPTVRRDQMSGFLIRTLSVLEADGDVRPLA